VEVPSITTCSVDNAIVLSGTGCLGIEDANDMTRALNVALIGRKTIIIDLVKAQYMDEAMLSCLLVLGRALARRGQRLRVTVGRQTQPESLLGESALGEWMDVTAL
jgi:anti-anti-sigma regulatory factor